MNLLPTGKNLNRIHIHIDSICPWCSKNQENDYHIFFSCDIIKKIWNTLDIPIINHETMHTSCHDALSDFLFLINRMKESKTYWLSKVAAVISILWKTRNDIIFNNGKFVPIQIINTARITWNNWETSWSSDSEKSTNDLIMDSLLSKEAPACSLSTTSITQWAKTLLSKYPNMDYIITVDGSFLNLLNQGSYGVSAIDKTGAVTLAYSHVLIQHVENALLMEALAMEKALILASLKGWDNFVLLSDSKTLIDYVNQSHHQIYIEWAIYPIMCNILRISQNFKSQSFAYFHRSSNIVAHNLANCRAKMSTACNLPFVR